MYLCVSGIHFASFYNFAIGFSNCSDRVVFVLILSLNLTFHPFADILQYLHQAPLQIIFLSHFKPPMLMFQSINVIWGVPAPLVAPVVLQLLSWTRKEWDSDYDKRNIFVVICDTYFVTYNQIMVATVRLISKWWQLNHLVIICILQLWGLISEHSSI